MPTTLEVVQSHFEKGQYKEAITLLNALIHKEATDDLYFNRALCYYFLKNYRKAYSDLKALKHWTKDASELAASIERQQRQRDDTPESPKPKKQDDVVDEDGNIKKLQFFKSDITLDNVIGL